MSAAQLTDHPPEAALMVAGELSETARKALVEAWQKAYSGLGGAQDFWIIEEPWPMPADPSEWWMAL